MNYKNTDDVDNEANNLPQNIEERFKIYDYEDLARLRKEYEQKYIVIVDTNQRLFENSVLIGTWYLFLKIDWREDMTFYFEEKFNLQKDEAVELIKLLNKSLKSNNIPKMKFENEYHCGSAIFHSTDKGITISRMGDGLHGNLWFYNNDEKVIKFIEKKHRRKMVSN